MEKLELQKLKQRKTDKADDRESKRHKSKAVKEHKAVVNGKEHTEGSGTMTFSYKKLQVPKELIKKAKKLVETTTGLNHTFIQFIQQGAAEQGDGSIRYRHLRAFKAVLADLKKAHSALEEALIPEFRNMEVQNGNEGQLAVTKSADVKGHAENDHTENVVDADQEDGDAEEEPDKEQPVQLNKEQRERSVKEPQKRPDKEQKGESDEKPREPSDDSNEQDLSNDQELKHSDGKDSQTETAVTKKATKSEVCDDRLLSAGEMSLDQDIMSVPPSVPEELFQMVESLADSTMLLQTDTNVVSNTEKNAENIKSNGATTDEQCPQPKVKNLIVKLTPVPVVTTSGSKMSRTRNREKDRDTPKKLKEECDKEKNGSPPPIRRSSRVKTTPLRKQTENIGKEESSDSELEEEGKVKSSNKSSNEDENQTRTVDSDSEVPGVLLEKAAAGHSTDEEQENTSAKKRLFKLNNTSAQDMDKVSKRKRKSESSGSDFESKTKKSSKKTKQKGSDSSSSDSNQEKAAKGKAGTAKRRSNCPKKEEDKNSPGTKGTERKRSYEKKGKRRSKPSSRLQSSSSSQDEEEQQADGDSGEDSDVQKIKPIVEDNVVESGGVFHQSSG